MFVVRRAISACACSFSTTKKVLPSILQAKSLRFSSTWIPDDLPKYIDGFNDIPELEEASNTVKSLFTLEMAGKKSIRNVIRTQNGNRYETVLEKNIANGTHHIRMLMESLQNNNKDKYQKTFFIWAINQRKKKLKRLKKLDVEKYNAIIEEYNIPPLEDSHDPKNKYRFRKYKINVPLEKRRKLEDFEKELVY